MPLYVALLRGINVGGQNLIRMPDLKASFEASGFRDVTTYIQSGNVLFRAPRSSSAALERGIEERLSKRFGYRASVFLRTHAQLRAVVAGAPSGFGTRPAQYRYDVLFLKRSVTPSSVLKVLPVHPEVDSVSPGRGVLYFSRLTSRATQSRLNRVAVLPVYKSMTIRNWNTTTKLLRLMDVGHPG